MTTNTLVTLSVPTLSDALGNQGSTPQASPHISIELDKGSKLFVVGANGAGKSALMNFWANKVGENIKIITAHRKNWMDSSAVNMVASQRSQNEQAYISYGKTRESRYKDVYQDAIISIALFDLVESENAFGRSALSAIDKESPQGVGGIKNLKDKFGRENRPIEKINNILKHGSLDIQISIGENQQIQARKNGKMYDASQLSDGERNALILSSHVLTARHETVLLIDEPEQHLHRAISSPLLSALIAERPDCAFIISTHEISLMEAVPKANILVLHQCYWNGSNPTAWECNMLRPNEDVPNEIRQAILGGRKRILFVEGIVHSLDRRLYEIVYPDFTVYPVGGCSEVIQAVKGLRNASGLHWVEARGIIDSDGRNEKDIANLKKDGIFTLSEFSIESILYGEKARRVIADLKAEELGLDANELSVSVKSNALSKLESDHCKHLVAKICETKIRKDAIAKVPKSKDILDNSSQKIEIMFPSPYSQELEKLEKISENKDIDALIANYPVRESPLLDGIAKALHYQSCSDYEAAVIRCAKNNEEFRQALKSVLPDIDSEVINDG